MKGLLGIAFLTTLFLSIAPARAQRQCGVVDYQKTLNPELKPYQPGGKAFEAGLRLARAARGMGGSTCDTGQIFRIPVVFHIIHKGEALGQGSNLPDTRMTEQIRILNEDFRRKAGTRGFNTDPRGADARIEFQLAGTDPNGQFTNGIVRVNGGNRTWSLADNDSLKARSVWPPDKYFNVWVCDLTGFYGYSSFPHSNLPFNGTPAYEPPDGSVINYRYIGNSIPAFTRRYNLGRTLTHEAGHFFGLIHIWGDTYCGEDYCDDTPSQTQDVYDCLALTDTNAYRCPGQPPIMVGNYMGYVYDSCMNTFTHDQVYRMRYVLCNTPDRASLTTSPGLVTQVQPTVPAKFFSLLQNRETGNFSLAFHDSGLAYVTVLGVDGRLVHKDVLDVKNGTEIAFSPDLVAATGMYAILIELKGRRQTERALINAFVGK